MGILNPHLSANPENMDPLDSQHTHRLLTITLPHALCQIARVESDNSLLLGHRDTQLQHRKPHPTKWIRLASGTTPVILAWLKAPPEASSTSSLTIPS